MPAAHLNFQKGTYIFIGGYHLNSHLVSLERLLCEDICGKLRFPSQQWLVQLLLRFGYVDCCNTMKDICLVGHENCWILYCMTS